MQEKKLAIFDYKGQGASEDVIEAYQLARVSQINAFGGISLLVDNRVVKLFSGSDYDTNFDLPSGWRELLPSELDVDPSLCDGLGIYSSATSSSAQVKITGKFENGQLTEIGVAFAGTSDFGDVLAYLDLEDQRIMSGFERILDVKASFAQANGLIGSDITVTGYSLGGAVTNALSFKSGVISNGFYADSNYFGFAYRAVGDVDESLVAGLYEVVFNDDKTFIGSTDNIVLFDDVYANPLFPLGIFSLLNVTNGWAAHVCGVFETPYTTLANSTFYDEIQTDPTVVIAALSPVLRGITRVSDVSRMTSDHYGSDAFLLGTDAGDKLRDGQGNDALDGFGGDDHFDLSTGTDRVAGCAGKDEVLVEGKVLDYDIYLHDDGVLYMESDTYGLKALADVEQVTFKGYWIDRTFDVESNKLDSRS